MVIFKIEVLIVMSCAWALSLASPLTCMNLTVEDCRAIFINYDAEYKISTKEIINITKNDIEETLSEASSFSCENLTPAACRDAFAEEFNSAFKTLHIPAVEELVTRYIKTLRIIVSELDPDDVFHDWLEELASNLTDFLEEMEENENNDEKFAEFFQNATDAMEWMMKEGSMSPKYEKSWQAHDVRYVLADVLDKIIVELVKLYTVMYERLRPEDLEDYPEYKEIKELVKKLQTKDELWKRSNTYREIRAKLVEKFYMPFMEVMNKIF